jgi:hypothetical protein
MRFALFFRVLFRSGGTSGSAADFTVHPNAGMVRAVADMLRSYDVLEGLQPDLVRGWRGAVVCEPDVCVTAWIRVRWRVWSGSPPQSSADCGSPQESSADYYVWLRIRSHSRELACSDGQMLLCVAAELIDRFFPRHPRGGMLPAIDDVREDKVSREPIPAALPADRCVTSLELAGSMPFAQMDAPPGVRPRRV